MNILCPALVPQTAIQTAVGNVKKVKTNINAGEGTKGKVQAKCVDMHMAELNIKQLKKLDKFKEGKAKKQPQSTMSLR